MTLFEYKSAMKFRQPLYSEYAKPAPVLTVSARTGDGIREAWAAIQTLTHDLSVKSKGLITKPLDTLI